MQRFAAAILFGAVASLSMTTTRVDGQEAGEGIRPAAISAISERVRPFVDDREVSGVVTLVATAGPDRAPGRDRQRRYRREQADAAGHDLLDRLDDQAGHGHGCPHVAGGGKAVGRRPGREAPAGVQGPQVRGRQADSDHDPPPAHAHLGHGRGHARRGSHHQGPGRAHPALCREARQVRAGHEMDLLPIGDQHRGPDRRGRLGRAVRPVRRASAVRPAGDEGYDLLSLRGAAPAARHVVPPDR